MSPMVKTNKKNKKTALWIKKAVDLIQFARQHSVRQTNSLIVYTYFHIGKIIIEQEQKGKAKAAYGDAVIKKLTTELTLRFGAGFSKRNLEQIRLFYLLFGGRVKSGESPEISSLKVRSRQKTQTLSAQSLKRAKTQTLSARSSLRMNNELTSPVSFGGLFPLAWSQYVILLRIKNQHERSFYEIEAAKNNWSVRELQRQYESSLFERLTLSKDKKKVKQLAAKGQIIEKPEDVIKSPYILEFLGLEEKSAYTESDLETAIINKIEHFLLEMGKGFLFGGRQVRFSFDEQNFYVDLVLYNRLLQCFVLVDLKMGELKHQDIGQMQMYVNYYDRYIKQEFEKPTVGIIICKNKSDAVVEITLPLGNKTIFANEYKLYLPSKAELKAVVK